MTYVQAPQQLPIPWIPPELPPMLTQSACTKARHRRPCGLFVQDRLWAVLVQPLSTSGVSPLVRRVCVGTVGLHPQSVAHRPLRKPHARLMLVLHRLD